MEVTEVSINKWMDKEEGFSHIMEFYSAIKKNKNLPFPATWMFLEGIMLAT